MDIPESGPMTPRAESGRSGTGSDFLNLDAAAAPSQGLTRWLTEALRTAIGDGRLAAGAPLPATRALARDLGVSRGVVVEAYQRLGDEGLVRAQTGRGTVAMPFGLSASRAFDHTDKRQMPHLAQPFGRWSADVEFNLSPGVPDLSAFPRAAWLRAERAVLREATAADLGYGDPRGSERLRQQLSSWLARTRGLRAEPSDIIVVAGVAQSLALLAQTLRARGMHIVAVEDPGSRGSRDELVHWGLTPQPVPVDDSGLQVEKLASVDAQAALLTPAHQFPTGVVLAPKRRRELIDWASRGRLIIEDDYDAEHRYDRAPVPALQASAPDLVAHTGSTSKTLAPGMRLGWLVPPRNLHADLVAAKRMSDLGSPAFPQLVLAHLIASGAYGRHIRTVRVRQRERRDVLLGALRERLPRAQVLGVAAGLHLLVLLPHLHGVDDLDLADRIHGAGVLVHPLSWHRLRPGPPGLVLGYAAHSPDRLREAAGRIASAVSEMTS
jgi:GntR family transcriptional regulator / MocR family aminotransferase